MEVYEALGFDEGVDSRKEGVLADGRGIELRSAFGSAELEETGKACEGPVDSWDGMEEVLAGARLLRRFSATLDYCSGVFRLAPCD